VGESTNHQSKTRTMTNPLTQPPASRPLSHLRFSHIEEVRKSANDGANLRRMDATSDPKKALVKWSSREREFRHKMREPRKHPLERKGVGVGSGKRRKIMKDVFVKVKDGKGVVKEAGKVVV
jgi:hypothetical protein